MKKDKVLQVIKVEPGKNPEVLFIKNDLKVMQDIVGGLIEPIEIADGVTIVCNEEGKYNGLPLNRALRTTGGEIWDIVAGTFFITGDDFELGQFVSLTDEQVEVYENKFHFPEIFYKKDGEICAKKIPAGWYPVMTGGDL